jgi:gas vesicle protein
MTSIAPEETRELEEDTRQAWSQYSERLRDLAGDEYERAESESWEALQDELRRVEERRDQLEASTDSSSPLG